MLDSVFGGLFDTASTKVISPGMFLLCVGCSLLIGLMLSLMTRWKTDGGSSLAITLALLPAAVCVVIMMVNGNVGAGVAVAGSFSLVRFRSQAGSGRDISSLFIAMGAGLLAGMGYLAYALLFAGILGAMMMLYTALGLGASGNRPQYRQLRITIPENLDYAGLFDPVLEVYSTRFELKQVKSANMGSLFKLTYDLTLRKDAREKQMLDDLRCLNGNLEIALSCQEPASTVL